MRPDQALLATGFALLAVIAVVASPGAAHGESLVGRSVAVREFRSSVAKPGDCGVSGCGSLVSAALANALAARGVTVRVIDNSAAPSGEAIVEGEVLTADAGNRAGRFWSLDLAGGAKVSVRGTVKDASGRLLGQFAEAAEAAGGSFGGSSEELLGVAVQKAAESVADRVASGRYR